MGLGFRYVSMYVCMPVPYVCMYESYVRVRAYVYAYYRWASVWIWGYTRATGAFVCSTRPNLAKTQPFSFQNATMLSNGGRSRAMRL